MIGNLIIGFLLVSFCGFYLTESILKGKVRVRGAGKESRWYHWAEQETEPVAYWFWTTFYTIGAFLGVYLLLTT